jgi:hypothetical protein
MLTRKTYTPDLEAEAAPIRLLARFLFPDARSRKHSDASDKTPKRQGATPAEAFDLPGGNRISKRPDATGFGPHSHVPSERV